MDERVLLILGLLMNQSQHGYQINDFIEKNLGRVSGMKKATAYALLKRLHKSGHVDVTVEKGDNRLQRHVYSITEKGKKAFFELLRDGLAHVEATTPSGDIGLLFCDHLPREEVIHYLTQRRDYLTELIEKYERAPRHSFGMGVALTVSHRITLFKADRDWLDETIARLANENR
ncbi:PadR family transcriptional regulator [Numidum massiliense]|uniref:PadR family transcriptional regulator n=1 Tax=Numidum massiliense TaxID=1522315 RepID=UPI0006D56EB9|nr:PadR family transcriptional regulator [Numidum massiliense]